METEMGTDARTETVAETATNVVTVVHATLNVDIPAITAEAISLASYAA
jgi:hypothetical protein